MVPASTRSRNGWTLLERGGIQLGAVSETLALEGSSSGLQNQKIQARPRACTPEPDCRETGRRALEITRITWQSGKTLRVIAALGEPRLDDTGVM